MRRRSARPVVAPIRSNRGRGRHRRHLCCVPRPAGRRLLRARHGFCGTSTSTRLTSTWNARPRFRRSAGPPCSRPCRPRARLDLAQDPQLVLRREPPPLGLLDQLGIRDPRRRSPPDGRRYHRAPGPTSRRAPFSPSRLSDSSVMNVSHDIGREGPSCSAFHPPGCWPRRASTGYPATDSRTTSASTPTSSSNGFATARSRPTDAVDGRSERLASHLRAAAFLRLSLDFQRTTELASRVGVDGPCRA